MKKILAGLALASSFVALPASAAVSVCTFDTFGCYGSGDLGAFTYVTGANANNVAGGTGYTGTAGTYGVKFTSTTDTLDINQAVGFPGIAITGNSPDPDLDQLSFTLLGGATFTGAIFDLTWYKNAWNDSNDSVTIYWSGGSQTVALPNNGDPFWEGTDNWFGVKATGGQKLTGLQFNGQSGGDGFGRLSSLKLTGLQVTTSVPEPSTWLMMILGFGLVGGVMRRRQSQTARIRFA